MDYSQAASLNRRPIIPQPDQMSLEQTSHGIIITRYWRSLRGWLVILFSILWIGLFVGLRSLTAGMTDPTVTLMMPLMHTTLGIGICYILLAHFINRTRITVSQSQITVAHSPLPWPGGCTMTTSRIEQLFCKEVRRRTNQGLQRRYQVWVVLTDGSQSKLVDLGLVPERALYVEQQIEMALNIRDREIPDELPR